MNRFNLISLLFVVYLLLIFSTSPSFVDATRRTPASPSSKTEQVFGPNWVNKKAPNPLFEDEKRRTPTGSNPLHN